MAELEIKAGHNQFDPLRDIIVDRNLPGEDDQDPAVLDRCPEIIKAASDLCLRYSDGAPVVTDGELTVYTPGVQYRLANGLSTAIRVGTTFTDTAPDAAPELYGPAVEAGLEVAHGDEWTWLIVVDAEGVFRQTAYDDEHAGSHTELNYMLNVITAIREAAFPKGGPAATEEAHRVTRSVGAATSAVVDTNPL